VDRVGDLRSFKRSGNDEFARVHRQIFVRKLLSVHKELVYVHLECDIANAHGCTFNLAPPVTNNRADMDVQYLVSFSIDVVAVNKDQVALAMELKDCKVYG
jgi:hypothetical protein